MYLPHCTECTPEKITECRTIIETYAGQQLGFADDTFEAAPINELFDPPSPTLDIMIDNSTRQTDLLNRKCHQHLRSIGCRLSRHAVEQSVMITKAIIQTSSET